MHRTAQLSGCVSIVFGALCTMWASALDAEEPLRRTQIAANYVAVEDVALSSPDGARRGSIKKGTKVAARLVKSGVFDVKSEDGKTGHAPSQAFSRLGSSIKITDEARQVSTASNQFGFELYQQLRQEQPEGNLFFSPASISAALAMTAAGAGGATRQEMATVLHIETTPATHEGYATLLQLLNSTGERNGYQLNTANRLWGADGYPFEKTFLQLTREKYHAELAMLNFGNPEKARVTINDWVEQQTREKIVDLIPPGVVRPDTRLVVTNAIYFAGGWSSEFPEGKTKEAPFHLSAQEQRPVQMMHQSNEFRYTEDDHVQVVALPYRGHELSMIVILPKAIDGLAEVEAQLTQQRYAAWMENLRGDRLVHTFLPKFTMRAQFELSEMLQSLGMSTAFGRNADFSRMSKSESLLISKVIHQAFVDVNEKGTEAAAATAVIVAPTSAAVEPEPPPPVEFRADHPFLVVIHDNRTGGVLFLGRLSRPEE